MLPRKPNRGSRSPALARNDVYGIVMIDCAKNTHNNLVEDIGGRNLSKTSRGWWKTSNYQRTIPLAWLCFLRIAAAESNLLSEFIEFTCPHHVSQFLDHNLRNFVRVRLHGLLWGCQASYDL